MAEIKVKGGELTAIREDGVLLLEANLQRLKQAQLPQARKEKRRQIRWRKGSYVSAPTREEEKYTIRMRIA